MYMKKIYAILPRCHVKVLFLFSFVFCFARKIADLHIAERTFISIFFPSETMIAL